LLPPIILTLVKLRKMNLFIFSGFANSLELKKGRMEEIFPLYKEYILEFHIFPVILLNFVKNTKNKGILTQ
jgi:hypothetical protein